MAVTSAGQGHPPVQPPLDRIGIIGGGQLAWMMAPAAEKLGLTLRVQTPQAQDPAATITPNPVLAPVADAAATAQLAQRCDVISFENEFIDLEALEPLADQGVLFRPSLTALAPLLNKYTQRQCLAAAGLPNPRFVALFPDTPLEKAAALAQTIGFPLVMKTQRLGYDGQGTHILPDWEACRQTWERLQRAAVLLEEFVPFEQELAVMVARSATGAIATYPIVTTEQVDQVCRRVIAPAPIAPRIQTQITTWAIALVESLDYVGVLGMEWFLAPGDRLLVNEVAPRTHNSGHYTLDACPTSQFEQQLRAVAGLPLGDTGLTWDRALMVNLLGYETADHDYGAVRSRLATLPHSHVYWYGKTARPGRKLGHVTLCLPPGASPPIPDLIQQIEALWYGS